MAAVVLLAANGRIAGVSGIVAGMLARVPGELAWRTAFVLGLVLGALTYALVRGEMLQIRVEAGVPLALAAGLLVGVGTRLGSGCTSGHGVCGIARLSPRSLLATAVFMLTGMLTVYLTRHVL